MVSLWIGPPGGLREIPDAATDYDRSVDLGAAEFTALGGGVTVTYRATPPRRLSLSWTGLVDGDARWLESLALRVGGPAALAVFDPTAVNMLGPVQAAGNGPASAWQLAGSGSLGHTGPAVTVTGTKSGSALRWAHPYWPGFPVLPGALVAFRSTLAPGLGTCVVDFLDATGAQLGSSTAGATVAQLPPPAAVFVRPAVLLSPITTPQPIGPAWLRWSLPISGTDPIPSGDGCPAMAVTGYTDKPAWPYRDMSLKLVEVTRAAS